MTTYAKTQRNRRHNGKPERFTCPECCKRVAAYVPRGGDGSARLLRSHVCRDKRRTSLVECPGWEMRR
jgi:hypothetical protein